MKDFQVRNLHDSACTRDAFLSAGVNHRPLWCLAFVIALLVSALSMMAAQTAPSRAAQIQDHLRKAGEFLKANDPGSAAKEFDAVLALDPRNAEAHANLGVIAFFQHDCGKASPDLRKALAIDPSLTKTQALLGICELRMGNPAAGAMLEKSFAKLQDKPLQLQVGMELENFYDRQGEPERAVAVMQKLVDFNPDDVNILYLAQRLYRELADDTLDKLAVIGPGSARMQQVIAERLVNAGDGAGAGEHYRKALEIDPRLPGVHFELAQVILESARGNRSVQDEAEKELATAISVDGDSAGVECELGAIAMMQGDLDKAHEHYARAFSMNPESTQAQLGLAQIFMAREKPQEARKYLEMAVKGDPLNGAAHYRLASTYRNLQMPDAAQKELRLFQEIKETKDQVRKLYRQMKSQYHDQSAEAPDDEKDPTNN